MILLAPSQGHNGEDIFGLPTGTAHARYGAYLVRVRAFEAAAHAQLMAQAWIMEPKSVNAYALRNTHRYI